MALRPSRKSALATLLLLASLALLPLRADAPTHYEPTLESLNQHPLPAVVCRCKAGNLRSLGALFGPRLGAAGAPEHDFTSQDYIMNNPYAEWYLNSMRIKGSPTQAYHREHYGANYDYYNFAPTFDREIQKWDPDTWAKIFHDAGAKYVVLTTKHHDGFTLWPSATPNPTLPPGSPACHTRSGRRIDHGRSQSGLRMGLYYSGGYDWTFVPGPIRQEADYQSVKPQSEAYGKYADAQVRELIKRYQPRFSGMTSTIPSPAIRWRMMAEYYNAVPDGVVDDRFGVKHSDFKSPEYQTLDKISPTKWEECRGLGRSFGYNRAEGEAETIAPNELIYLLVDIISKNGNLLLDVGPEADGTIPPVQMSPPQGSGSMARYEWRRHLWHSSMEARRMAKPRKVHTFASPRKIPLSTPFCSASPKRHRSRLNLLPPRQEHSSTCWAHRSLCTGRSREPTSRSSCHRRFRGSTPTS